MGSIINTFDKGLHQDSAFILQPDGTYRNMRNGMLISYDGNHYTVELTKGNKVLLTLTPRYLDVVSDLDIVPMPIGFASFIDKLVVFSTNSEITTGYGEIGVISFVRNGMDFIGSYVPYYNHDNLNFTRIHKIEAFTFAETDNINRVYWTDNFNEPRVFDIQNPIFTTYIASFSLVVGTQYMVLEGAIVYNSDEYGPGLAPTTTAYSNIFTASIAGGTTYAVSDGTPLVVEYYPLELLDWSPNRLLGEMAFNSYGTGNKNCGSSMYFYRLSSSDSGIVTSWSYPSDIIHVGMANESTFTVSGNSYANFVGNGTATSIENSGKSIKVTLTDIDTNFDTIEVAVIEYDQKTDIPYRTVITNKEIITGSSMVIEDVGNINLGDLTISDLTLFPASILKCKTLATNKNYSIVANITEREEFELDLSTVAVTQFEYPLIAHGDIDVCTNGNVPADQSPTALELTTNPGVGAIKPWSRYIVTLAPNALNSVEYPASSGAYYYTGDVFVGVAGSVTATFTGTAQARPCTTRNKYTKINSTAFSGDRVEDAIKLETAFWDYKDPAVASHNKGYWSDETYRIGILFYDLKGIPFYAKHIKDFKFYIVDLKNGLMISEAYPGGNVALMNPSALNISALDIPESVMDNCSGFSIVRAERDPIIIAQALLMQSTYSTSDNSIQPLGLTRTDYSTNATLYTPLGDLCAAICPDWLVGYGFSNPIGVISQTIKEAFWLDGDHLKTYTGDARVLVTKMFTTFGGDSASPRTMTLQSMNGVGFISAPEDSGTSNIIGDTKDYFNDGSPVNCANITTGADDTCSAIVYGLLNSVYSTGSKKLVILPNHFNHWGPTGQYNGWAENTIYQKIVVNFLTDTSSDSQYGGTSDAALGNTLYMSTGHFQPINSTVKAHTLNGTFASGTYVGQNKYTFNDIEIFGGDCFTNLIDYGYGLWNDNYNLPPVLNAMSYSMWFPMECNANYNLRRGRKVSNADMYPNDPISTSLKWSTPTRLESYSYNLGYSSEGTIIKYPALPLNYRFANVFRYRERWSSPKIIGESADSFRTFRTNDYRDLDGQRGQINNLKAKDSKLFYWQDHSVGYTPILERQLVGGSALGDATALGVTGVIDRFDDIDTYFGNQHQHGLTETEYGFAWFDMRRRAFMVMGVGTRPDEVSMTKGLQVFFNSEFDEGNIYYPNSYSAIYNTNNLSIPEVPLMGYGIVGCYDPTFKMTYLTFKYVKQDFIEVDNQTYVNRDFTLGYNHILNAFVSFYDNCPAIWHNHNDLVLTANNSKNTKGYNSDMPSTAFVIGDTVKVGNIEYICIKDITIVSYPGTLTAITGTNPLAPSSNSWLAINKTNEIYLQNFGADLCKFYGKVWDYSQEVVVNFKTDVAVTPQNIQLKSTGRNFTDIEYSNDDQTSQDLNISATNRNHRWIDKSWFSSVALPSNGRLTDYYIKIKFTLQNYVTDPTTSINIQKISQWLKTMFVTKK